jgi:cytochrome P450
LGFLDRCAREGGDVVSLRFFNRTVLLLRDPATIEAALATNSRHFKKTIGYRTPFMRRLFGQGLLTSEGDLWLRQRRLAQPAFHRERIAGYGDIVAGFTGRMLEEWRDGETREVHGDMMRLTTQVVVKTLFNSSVPREIDDLGRASAAVMERFESQMRGLGLLLGMLPTPSTIRFGQVMRRLDAYIYTVIRERRQNKEDPGDLLSMLLKAQDEDGSGMTDRQLRDELTTLMVAGLDTTALALSWALLLLSQNPETQERLAREVRTILGDAPPQAADLPRLGCVDAVIKEAMRLYPPAWIIGREAMNNCEIGGRSIAAGASILASQWLAHRDPRNFPEPERFRPERWADEAARNLPKFAYFPFGGGPRICIGAAFAMLEATLALAMIAGRFRVEPGAGPIPRPWAVITLQPRGGIRLKVTKRV